jgi:hypothetical protein
MPSAREVIKHFIESEGHRVDAAPVDPETGVGELLFRTRGQVFSVTTSEDDENILSISTAYEIPDWAREQQNTEALDRVHKEHPTVVFTLAHDGGLFVATLDERAASSQELMNTFWTLVARLRDAGAQAIEDIVDRTESKVAAEKFINSLLTDFQ